MTVKEFGKWVVDDDLDVVYKPTGYFVRGCELKTQTEQDEWARHLSKKRWLTDDDVSDFEMASWLSGVIQSGEWSTAELGIIDHETKLAVSVSTAHKLRSTFWAKISEALKAVVNGGIQGDGLMGLLGGTAEYAFRMGQLFGYSVVQGAEALSEDVDEFEGQLSQRVKQIRASRHSDLIDGDL